MAKSVQHELLKQAGGWKGVAKRAIGTVLFAVATSAVKGATKALIENEPRAPDNSVPGADDRRES